MSTNVPTATGGYSEKEVNDAKALAAIGYVALCCLPGFLVPMLAAKENRYAQYHARQGATLWITVAGASIAAFILQTVASMVSGMLAQAIGCLSLIVFLPLLVLMVIGIVNALQGQAKELPVIGQFASKLPF